MRIVLRPLGFASELAPFEVTAGEATQTVLPDLVRAEGYGLKEVLVESVHEELDDYLSFDLEQNAISFARLDNPAKLEEVAGDSIIFVKLIDTTDSVYVYELALNLLIPADAVTDSPPIPPPPSEGGSAMVVGILVGTVCAIALAVGLYCYCKRRNGKL